MMVLGMNLEMLSEIRDSLAENSDLNFWGTCVALMLAIRTDYLSLSFLNQRHALTPLSLLFTYSY